MFKPDLNAFTLFLMIFLLSCNTENNSLVNNNASDFEENILYSPVPAGVKTRWISPENPTGEKGKGGATNKGAKGNAFFIVQPGETKILMDVKGQGIIQRIWVSGTLATSAEQRRAVRLDMFWDGAVKPAVSAPFGDFFGTAHGLLFPFESKLFVSPEGRSFVSNVKMPFKKSAHISITNESASEVWIWYDINYLEVDKLPENILYFHAYWNRNVKTTLAEDYTILPKVEGSGRFIGTNIGIIGDEHYKGTWFGEGEVKIFLDGDTDLPTLVGTGTEDYIGTGWGQGEFSNLNSGSVISNKEFDIYAFYRFHTEDAVFFNENCKVTIQQMGNSTKSHILNMIEKGAELQPVWFLDNRNAETKHGHLLDEGNGDLFNSPDFPETSTNFYRSDDVCATAYFYLDKPESNLPELAPLSLRLSQLEEKVNGPLKNIRK
ncbi:MAG TPA: DUF2961 domain-containing protein [Draconibacterium sp.]|nr:DUF2961 domain-containing protein [Draconibacterium sp.]